MINRIDLSAKYNQVVARPVQPRFRGNDDAAETAKVVQEPVKPEPQAPVIATDTPAKTPEAAPEKALEALPSPSSSRPAKLQRQANPNKGRWKRALMLNMEFIGRKVSSTYAARKYAKQINHFLRLFKNVPVQSKEYVQALQKTAEFYVGDREFEVNTESGRLRDIVNSDDACIFIMNHDHQSEDPSMLGMFSMILYQEYLDAGKGATCPRPKILLNRDIIDTISDRSMRNLYLKMGAVGVDASVGTESNDTFKQIFSDFFGRFRLWGKPKPKSNPGMMANSRQMMGLLKGFNQNQNHIFIFPEGRLSAVSDDVIIKEFKQLPLEKQLEAFPLDRRPPNLPLEEQLRAFALRERFQTGVGEMVRMASKRKKNVKVVPLGFSFNTKEAAKKLGSIYIGEPIVFQRNATGQLTCSASNVTPEDATPSYVRVFKKQLEDKENNPLRPFTEKDGDLGSPISGVLFENLRICKIKAMNNLPTENERDSDRLLDPLKRV